jgi:hypothetical protein
MDQSESHIYLLVSINDQIICYLSIYNVNFISFFQAFHFHADKEVLREPRVVRVGLIQNSIALPTTAHFVDQKKAIFEKLKPIIDAAGSSGVNILCLQVGCMQLSIC